MSEEIERYVVVLVTAGSRQEATTIADCRRIAALLTVDL